MASRQERHGDIAEDLSGGGMAALRGFGTGASMGLVKYPSALVMKMLDAFMGQGMTWSEAIDAINRQQQQDREQNPIATAGGELAGALVAPVPGLGTAKATTTLGKLGLSTAKGAATGAIQGGVSSFNENQSLDEAGKGAIAGATLGALGGAAQVAQAAGVEKMAQLAARKQKVDANNAIKHLDDLITDAAERKARMTKVGVDTADVQSELYRLQRQKTEVKAAQSAARKTASTARGFANNPERMKKVTGALNKGAVEDVLGSTSNRLGAALGGALTPGDMLLGAAGAGAGYLAGGDPTTMMVLGALSPALARGAQGILPAKAKLGASMLSAMPNAGPTAARAANLAIVPRLAAEQPMPPQPAPQEPAPQVQAEPDVEMEPLVLDTAPWEEEPAPKAKTKSTKSSTKAPVEERLVLDKAPWE